jgi:hypothetical protein
VANRTWKSLLLKKVILESPERKWSGKELSDAAMISRAYCVKQVNELLNLGIVSHAAQHLIVLRDADRLRLYLENSNNLGSKEYYFAPETPAFCAKRVDEAAARFKLPYSITGELGLWTYYKHIQPILVHCYIKRTNRPSWRKLLEKELKYFPSPQSRATLVILPTDDPYPFLNLANYDGYVVPPFIQVYLDCFVMGGRLSDGAKEAWQSIRA